MQLKVSTDYAMRMVLYIATINKVATSKELSEKLSIPQSIVFKIGKKLSDHGLITITTGVRGGFLLKKKPEEITMFDIIEMFESTTKLNRCLEDDKYCSRFAGDHCPVRNVYCRIQERFEEDLKRTTFKDLIQDFEK